MRLSAISLALWGALALVSFRADVAGSQYAAVQEAKDSLRRALNRGRVQHYTVYREGGKEPAAQYDSETIVFEPRGMGPLYNATHVILSSVLGDDPFPDGLFTIEDNSVIIKDNVAEDWASLLQHYAALVSVVIFGLLLAIVTPIVGFCFCCCRCAGSCGARSQPFDKKHDTCRRVFLGLFLILVATAMLFGVVVAFVTNSYMQEGIENAPSAARTITNDSVTFLGETSNHMKHLLVDNFDELSTSLMVTLKDSAEVVTDELAERSKAVSLKDLNNIVETLPKVKDDLIFMKDSTLALRINASQLNDGLRRVKRELLRSLNNCEKQACRKVLNDYKIGQLDTSGIDFNQLPDPTDVLKDLDKFVGGPLEDEIENGLREFNGIKDKFEDAVENNIGPIEKSIDDAGGEIRKQSDKMMQSLENIRGAASKESNRFIQMADDYIQEYSQYRYYVGLALSAILLLVLVCVSFGLLCGICGKRPDGYGDDCCNKGAGSTFLMCAVAVMFLSTTVLAVAALAHFVIGLLVHRAVCVPLQNPTTDKMFNLYDELINLDQMINGGSPYSKDTFTLSQIIKDCHANKSAYEVFKLDLVLGDDIDDIIKYADRFKIGEQLQNLLEEFKISNVQIMTDATKKDLEELEKSPLSEFKFYLFSQTLSEDITSVDLSKLANQLEETAKEIGGTRDIDYLEIIQNLRNQALVLRSYQSNLVTPMATTSVSLIDISTRLDVSLKFGKGNFSDAIRDLKLELIEAQKFLDGEGPEFVKLMVEEIVKDVEARIHEYLHFVVNQTKTNVGQCGPMSSAYNATLIAVCNNVLDPFNGFWAGLGWSILLFIPCIILSVKLSGLYQKSDPYPGPLAESEYLYDAYSDRDNISLTSPPEGKRRKDHKHERNAHRESNSQGPSASHEDRYTDMARKLSISNPYDAVYNHSNPNRNPNPRNAQVVHDRWAQYNGSHHM